MFTTSLVIILIAAVAAAFLGWIWYLPQTFGGAWMRIQNFTPEQQERAKKRMPLMALFGLLVNMICAYVLWYFAVAWQVYDWSSALELAFWVWAGFFVPVLMGSVLWEQKPFRLFLINGSYWLVSLAAMSLLIVLGAHLFIFGSFS